MPMMYSHITLGVVYHPPNSNNWKMTQHISKCVDAILQKHPHSGIIITGDFNKFKDNSIKSAYSLKQIVSKPTRGSNILDKVLTNMFHLYNSPEILPQIGRSDHFSVLCKPVPIYDQLGTTPVKKTKSTSGKNEKALFASALMSVNWEPLYRLSSCEEQFDLLNQTIHDLLDTFLPFITVTTRPCDKPWVTERYKDLIKRRQKALHAGNMDEYRQLRNKVNRMGRQLRSAFYDSTISELSQGSCKKWWLNMNNLMGRKQVNNVMTKLANEFADGDELVLANKINATFQAVSSSLPKLQPTHQHPQSLLPDKYNVSVEEVEKKLMKIEIKKAQGPDGIPNWILRDFCGYLAPPIASIFNSSFREGFIPSIWKSADVVPLPKITPPKRLEKDLRPISLTPVISKIQESFMHKWLWDVIRNIVDKNQFGAIKGTCTTHALILMLHEWLKDTDDSRKKNFVKVVLLDYAKAFDHIDANILIRKLEAMIIPDPLLRWIESFLTNRRQRVKIGSTISEWLEVWGTVPQGTLIGVLCFLCMINDLQTPCPTIKYVDDTTVYKATNDTQDMSLQAAIDSAILWSHRNSMNINPIKSKEMLISFARKIPDVPHIVIDGQDIERVPSCKLLGVTLNEKLTWDDHIDLLYKKCCQKLHFLTKLRRAKVSSMDLVRIYTSVIRPCLEYACQVWHGSLTDGQHDQLEIIQVRALAMAYPAMSYEEACAQANVTTLRQRRTTLCQRLFQDCQEPNHRLFALLPPPREYSYNCRNKYPYPQPNVKTNRLKNSFINYCISNRL